MNKIKYQGFSSEKSQNKFLKGDKRRTIYQPIVYCCRKSNNYFNGEKKTKKEIKKTEACKEKKSKIMEDKCGEPLDIADERERKGHENPIAQKKERKHPKRKALK